MLTSHHAKTARGRNEVEKLGNAVHCLRKGIAQHDRGYDLYAYDFLFSLTKTFYCIDDGSQTKTDVHPIHPAGNGSIIHPRRSIQPRRTHKRQCKKNEHRCVKTYLGKWH